MTDEAPSDPSLSAYKVALAELTARYQLKLRELREGYAGAKKAAWASFKSERGRLQAQLRIDRERNRKRAVVPVGVAPGDREFRADGPPYEGIP